MRRLSERRQQSYTEESLVNPPAAAAMRPPDASRPTTAASSRRPPPAEATERPSVETRRPSGGPSRRPSADADLAKEAAEAALASGPLDQLCRALSRCKPRGLRVPLLPVDPDSWMLDDLKEILREAAVRAAAATATARYRTHRRIRHCTTVRVCVLAGSARASLW